jgi:hypothetical protein
MRTRFYRPHLGLGNRVVRRICARCGVTVVPRRFDLQRLGGLIDSPDNISVLRNLWLDNQSRNPKGKANLQYINNVVYNWGSNGYVGGHSAAAWNQDLINN